MQAAVLALLGGVVSPEAEWICFEGLEFSPQGPDHRPCVRGEITRVVFVGSYHQGFPNQQVWPSTGGPVDARVEQAARCMGPAFTPSNEGFLARLCVPAEFVPIREWFPVRTGRGTAVSADIARALASGATVESLRDFDVPDPGYESGAWLAPDVRPGAVQSDPHEAASADAGWLRAAEAIADDLRTYRDARVELAYELQVATFAAFACSTSLGGDEVFVHGLELSADQHQPSVRGHVGKISTAPPHYLAPGFRGTTYWGGFQQPALKHGPAISEGFLQMLVPVEGSRFQPWCIPAERFEPRSNGQDACIGLSVAMLHALAAGATLAEAHAVADAERASAYDPHSPPDGSAIAVAADDVTVYPG